MELMIDPLHVEWKHVVLPSSCSSYDSFTGHVTLLVELYLLML